MTTVDVRAEHCHSQALSPRLQHAVRLLHMSPMDYAAALRDTLDKNPFLERDEGDACDKSEPRTVPLNPQGRRHRWILGTTPATDTAPLRPRPKRRMRPTCRPSRPAALLLQTRCARL